MDKMFYSPSEFVCRSDAEAVQAAVNAAAATDIRVVVIPAKADGTAWHLEKTVYLPEYMTVILDGAAVRTDGTAFMNANAEKPETKSLGGEQHQIYIVGRSGAAIVSDYAEPQILLSNVSGYRIAGITFRGGAGVKLHFARHGKLQQLKFRGSVYGIRLSEGCNCNIIEDICAVTEKEAVCFQGAESPMFGRGLEMAETIVCRVGAQTKGAPALRISPGPCETYNLMVRDVTSLTEGVEAVRLGAPEDTPVIDISLRGISSKGLAVKTCGSCDGLYIANATGGVEYACENVRVFVDDSQTEEIAAPRFPEEGVPQAVLSANDPAFRGETDAQTLQNAVNAAAKQGAMLLIPRWNDRTRTTVWNIEKAVALPSNTTVALLGTHLRQADFCYDNLFAAENAENITILGVGDAVIDGGKHNQLKTRNAAKYGMNIRANATLHFRNVENLVLDGLQMKNARWYSIYCEFCGNSRISNIDFENHPFLPDMGGVRLHSGCHHFLVENLTGIVGENLVHLEALEGDGTCGEMSADICHIHIRNLSSNNGRRLAARILCHDGRGIHDVLLENVLDPSLPENKMVPYAAVAVGTVQLATKRLCSCQELTDIRIRDIYARASTILELGGNSAGVSLVNAHGFGSCGSVLRTRQWADSRQLSCHGLFFRCIQGSPYMRGTATSVIKDPKKFIGHIAILNKFKAQDALLEHIFAEKVGDAFRVSGGCKVTVRDCNIGQLGRKLSHCQSDSVIEIDGEVQPTMG